MRIPNAIRMTKCPICAVVLLAVTFCGCDRYEGLRAQNQQLQDELNCAKKEIESLQEQLGRMNENLDKTRHELAEARRNFEQLTALVENQEVIANERVRNLERNEGSVKKKVWQMSGAEKEIKTLFLQLERAKNSLESTRNALTNANRTIVQLRTKDVEVHEHVNSTIGEWAAWKWIAIGAVTVLVVLIVFVAVAARKVEKVMRSSRPDDGLQHCPRCGWKHLDGETKCRKCGTRF